MKSVSQCLTVSQESKVSPNKVADACMLCYKGFLKNMLFYVYILLSASIAAAGNVLLKFGMTSGSSLSYFEKLISSPGVWAGLGLYGISWLFYVRVMSMRHVALVVPVFTALSFILVSVAALIFLEETIDIRQILGFACILGGMTIGCRTGKSADSGETEQ